MLVRYPIEATDPRPVVIWHHGGATSARGGTRSEEWGNALARAGYVVVHPSRVLPADVTPFLGGVRRQRLPRSRAVRRVVRHPPSGAADDDLPDRPPARPRAGAARPRRPGEGRRRRPLGRDRGDAGDRRRLQQFVPGGPVYDDVDPRPIAFLATAPQGPMYAGFRSGFDEERSFGGITRPLLTITGMGDETGEPVPTRLTAWVTSPPGDKLLVWDTDPHAVHETMDIHKCDAPVPAGHCDWIESAGLAYLDAVVRTARAAKEWLDSDALKTLTGGAIELHRR